MANEKTKDIQESYWDKAGIPRVTLHNALWQIEASIKTGQTRGAWCLISEAGEGKSQSVNALLKRHNYRVCDIRTAQLTHVGAGVPQRAKDGFFEYAVPKDFPQPGERAAIVFDEVNQGQPFAIALVFKMIEDRGLYGYKLPDDCPVILLMNPGTNAYNVSRIETNPAINRRIKKLYVYNTFHDWRIYAESEAFHSKDSFKDEVARPAHPMVVKYLTAAPNTLYVSAERDGGKQFCCPATWQTVSHDMYTLEHVGEPLTSDRALMRYASSINVVQAGALIEFIRNNELLIVPEQVLLKYKPKSKLRDRILAMQKEPGGAYQGLTERVANELFHAKLPVEDVVAHFALFWADMPIELRAPYFKQLQVSANDEDSKVSSENLQYMKKLTSALNSDPNWAKINESARDVEQAGAEELEAGKNAAKALKGAPKR